jgi:hypothetical protein
MIPVAKFIVLEGGDKVDSGIRLSYRPASLWNLAGRYDNPMPEWSQPYPPQIRDYEFGYCLSYPTEGRNCTLCTNCKLLRSPGIDSKESILPAYLAWWAGTSNMGCRTARQSGNRFLGSVKVLQIRALYSVHCTPPWDYVRFKLTTPQTWARNLSPQPSRTEISTFPPTHFPLCCQPCRFPDISQSLKGPTWNHYIIFGRYFDYFLGVTKRCRLSWLTNSDLVYEPECGGGLRGLSQWVQRPNS